MANQPCSYKTMCLAYSILAGLPAVYGLYTTFFPVLIYFFMGTSKHLSMGTFAVVSLMCRETVGRVLMERFPHASALEMGPPGENFHLNDNGTNTDSTAAPGGVDIEAERVKIHVALCLIVGILQVVMGILRCGFVTVYLSEALVRAFTTGAAFHVLTSQVPSALGINVPGRSLGDKTPEIIFVWRHLLTHLGESNTATIIIFMISFAVIFLTKEIIEKFKDRINFNIPIELIVVAISIIVSKFAYMHSRHGVDTIFEIKTGFPPPQMPSMFGPLFGSLIGDSFAIAIVAFALSVSLSKTFATRNNYEIDANQEMLSYGVSNIISSFFHCFVCCGALARTSIQEAVGGKTQIVTLVSSTMVMLVLLFMAPWFEPLPKSVLAAIICAGLKGMFLQFRDLHFLFRYSKYDFIIWVSTWAAVVFIGVDLGLGVGVIVALFVTVVRTQTPNFSTRGNVNGTELYKNIKRYPSAKEYDQVKIVQMQGSLYFANAEMFRNQVYDSVGINPVKVLVKIQKAQAKDKKLKKKKENPDIPNDVIELTGANEEHVRTQNLKIKAIIIDCGHFGFVDSMGAKTMASLVKDFKAVGVCVVLSSCSDSVMQSLSCLSSIRKELFYMTVHDAWLSLQNIRLQVESIMNGEPRKKRPSRWKRFRTREATI
nr:pendrin-like [Lytechinus pictus]